MYSGLHMGRKFRGQLKFSSTFLGRGGGGIKASMTELLGGSTILGLIAFYYDIFQKLAWRMLFYAPSPLLCVSMCTTHQNEFQKLNYENDLHKKLPAAQNPSATPGMAPHASEDKHCPNIGVPEGADDRTLHWLF